MTAPVARKAKHIFSYIPLAPDYVTSVAKSHNRAYTFSFTAEPHLGFSGLWQAVEELESPLACYCFYGKCILLL